MQTRSVTHRLGGGDSTIAVTSSAAAEAQGRSGRKRSLEHGMTSSSLPYDENNTPHVKRESNFSPAVSTPKRNSRRVVVNRDQTSFAKDPTEHMADAVKKEPCISSDEEYIPNEGQTRDYLTPHKKLRTISSECTQTVANGSTAVTTELMNKDQPEPMEEVKASVAPIPAMVPILPDPVVARVDPNPMLAAVLPNSAQIPPAIPRPSASSVISVIPTTRRARTVAQPYCGFNNKYQLVLSPVARQYVGGVLRYLNIEHFTLNADEDLHFGRGRTYAYANRNGSFYFCNNGDSAYFEQKSTGNRWFKRNGIKYQLPAPTIEELGLQNNSLRTRAEMDLDEIEGLLGQDEDYDDYGGCDFLFAGCGCHSF